MAAQQYKVYTPHKICLTAKILPHSITSKTRDWEIINKMCSSHNTCMRPFLKAVSQSTGPMADHSLKQRVAKVTQFSQPHRRLLFANWPVFWQYWSEIIIHLLQTCNNFFLYFVPRTTFPTQSTSYDKEGWAYHTLVTNQAMFSTYHFLYRKAHKNRRSITQGI